MLSSLKARRVFDQRKLEMEESIFFFLFFVGEANGNGYGNARLWQLIIGQIYIPLGTSKKKYICGGQNSIFGEGDANGYGNT